MHSVIYRYGCPAPFNVAPQMNIVSASMPPNNVNVVYQPSPVFDVQSYQTDVSTGRKRSRAKTSTESMTSRKKRCSIKVDTLLFPRQAHDFLPDAKGNRVSPEEASLYSNLKLPEHFSEYVLTTSSKKEKVWLPVWVELDGVRFDKMEEFPNTNGDSFVAGAQACVGAYARPFLQNDVSGLPTRIALKGVPMFSKRTRQRQLKKGIQNPVNPRRKTTWSSEWKMHHYLKQTFKDFDPEDRPAVNILGGLCTQVNGVHQIFFALELMDTDLFNVIEGESEDGQHVISMLLNTAKSLKALHDSGIIFCDLKPENILVCREGNLAKFGDFDRSCVPEFKVGVIGGTKGYESPERMQDSMKKSIEDDIWAFGVILLIAGTCAGSPFSDFSEEEIKNFSPSRYLLKHHRKDWSRAQVKVIGTACNKILQFNPEERASLDEVISLLEQTSALSKSTPEVHDLTLDDDSVSCNSSNLIDLTREAPLSDDQYSVENCSSSYAATTPASPSFMSPYPGGMQIPYYSEQVNDRTNAVYAYVPNDYNYMYPTSASPVSYY